MEGGVCPHMGRRVLKGPGVALAQEPSGLRLRFLYIEPREKFPSQVKCVVEWKERRYLSLHIMRDEGHQRGVIGADHISQRGA